MKTPQEIERARDVVTKTIEDTPGMSKEQKLILMGMSVALCWAADARTGGSTLQALIDGHQIAPGKTTADAFREMKEDGIEITTPALKSLNEPGDKA